LRGARAWRQRLADEEAESRQPEHARGRDHAQPVQQVPEPSRIGQPVQDWRQDERDQRQLGEAHSESEQADERRRHPEAAGEQGDDRQCGVGAGGCGQGSQRRRPRVQPGGQDRQRDGQNGGSPLRGRDSGLVGRGDAVAEGAEVGLKGLPPGRDGVSQGCDQAVDARTQVGQGGSQGEHGKSPLWGGIARP
jgi:hypothetical protein